MKEKNNRVTRPLKLKSIIFLNLVALKPQKLKSSTELKKSIANFYQVIRKLAKFSQSPSQTPFEMQSTVKNQFALDKKI